MRSEYKYSHPSRFLLWFCFLRSFQLFTIPFSLIIAYFYWKFAFALISPTQGVLNSMLLSFHAVFLIEIVWVGKWTRDEDYTHTHPRPFSRFQGSKKNAYSFWMEQGSEYGLASIERERFSLSNCYIRSQNRIKNVFRILLTLFHWRLNFSIQVKTGSLKQYFLMFFLKHKTLNKFLLLTKSSARLADIW